MNLQIKISKYQLVEMDYKSSILFEKFLHRNKSTVIVTRDYMSDHINIEFKDSKSKEALNLTGREKISLTPKGTLKPQMTFDFKVTRTDGSSDSVEVISRIDTADELEYFKNGGILQFVLRRLYKES